MEEIWREIPGFEGKYIASNTGKIRTLKNTYTRTCGNRTIVAPSGHFKKDSIVGKKLSPKGYCRVNLEDKTYFVHRLIAATFIPNPNNYAQVNHIDGNKLNNNINNLEWTTNQKNRDHAVKNKLISYGEKCGHNKLTLPQVREIIKLYKTGNYSQKEIGIKYNVKQGTIWSILSGRSWKLALTE